MENRKIFVPGNLTPPHGFIPVPAYFTNTAWRLASNGIWSGLQLLGLLFVILIGAVSITYPSGSGPWFAHGSMMTQFLMTALPAMGMLVVFANGSLDLSMGAVGGLTGVIAAQAMANGASPVPALLAGLLAALCFGLINGALVGAARIPGLLVTMVTGIIARGLCTLSTEGQMVIVREDLPAVPAVGWLFFVLLAAAVFLWIQFPAFNARRALGASRLREMWQAGLPYVVSALAAGVYGLVMISHVRAATYQSGMMMDFENMAVLILAGACLYGRYGNVIGVFLGALSLTLLRTLLLILNVSVFAANAALGFMCLFGLGWLYLYHWIVGLIHRHATAGKTDAASGQVSTDPSS